MIAGLINQAKRILEKYDEVLCGSSPEVLVQESHNAIGDLLKSPNVTSYFRQTASPYSLAICWT